MSDSLDSFLTRIGDVTIERVIPLPGQHPNETSAQSKALPGTNMNNTEQQAGNDDSSEDSSGETSDLEQEKKNDVVCPTEVEEIRSEGSGDDMDLDETIDSQIGVRMESERQLTGACLPDDDEEEPVNILDTLPLEGAPIEGQEVSEADLLGKPISKDSDDDEGSIDNDNDKSESHSGCEDGADGNKRRADCDATEMAKKKQRKDDGTEGSASECETKAEKKLANMRRNIREVMDETQLDEATLSAQRQEMERLRRVQEQQRIIREVQRQIAINRQNNKTQTRVISLLQGKQSQAGTTISQSSPASSVASASAAAAAAASPHAPSTHVRLPGTVLLKVNSGTGPGSQTSVSTQSGPAQRRSTDPSRWQKGRGMYQGAQTSISRVSGRTGSANMLQQRIRMMTPSVSISPVVPKKELIDRSEYYSDSDISDIDGEEGLRDKQAHATRRLSGGPKSQKLTKGKDVVTISSSSESSDDDCIVLSDPSGEEETDNEDDPSNSGMHTNDRYNIPDEHGRVLINVGHPESEPDVFLAPQVARIIKPHQIGGIRFLYDNIVESIERYKTSSGFGCILAHSMGLGKTLQVASFCDIFFRCTTAKTVLCIMPINTLQNWLAEFNMWLPYEDPSAERTVKGTNIKLEPGVDIGKTEMKEDCGTQSDVSNVSRPISRESTHHLGHDNAPQPLHAVPDNPYVHHGYHGMMSGYIQDGMLNKGMPETNGNVRYQAGLPQSPLLYNTNAQSASNFDPMKQELNCRAVQNRSEMAGPKYGMEGPNAGNVYPGVDGHPSGSVYSEMENRHSATVYPSMTDHQPIYPNYNGPTVAQSLPSHNIPLHGLPLPPPPPHNQLPPLPSLNPQAQCMTSQHNQPSDCLTTHGGLSQHQSAQNSLVPFPNYDNRRPPALDNEPRNDVSASSKDTVADVKTEHEEPVRREEGTCTSKDETGEDKKNVERVKTPYSVDAPIGTEMRPRHFRLHILNDSHKTMTARARVIQEWQTNGGVLLIGYELYRQLSLKKPNKAKRKRGQPSFKDTVDVEEEDKNKGLLDEMHTALVSPGPDLVICDEGHRIKNSHASISMALKQMRTKRRIVLTGYPLQNNLLEYWCMVDFVRPNYLGTKSEFCNMFERPIQNGQCIDSTPQDIRLMRYRAHVLHALLEGFVQRRSHSVLQVSLPRKEEYILLVRMTAHQRKLYDTFMNQVVKTRAVPNPLKAFAVCCKIWNHPDILYHFLRKRQANEEDDLDLEETIAEKATTGGGGKRSKARQAKGEPKKGKKTNAVVKNKPAASVQPNASSSSNAESAEGDSSHNGQKQGNYTSYPLPVTTSAFTGTVPQSPFPQSYQNYRSADQNTFYRNDNGHSEYSEFYSSQGQQRYGNQSFQTYPQPQAYNPSQAYSNQSQNYLPTNEPPGGHQRYTPNGPPATEFRSDQSQNSANNYEPSAMFPRQSFPYQDQGRSYTPALNQGANFAQVQNQSPFQGQLSNQSMPDYAAAYAPANQNQSYPASQNYPRNENQPSQQSAGAVYANQQNPNPSVPSSGPVYAASPQTQSQPPNLGLQGTAHPYPGSQQSTNVPHQGQPHGYGSQIAANPPSQHGFNQPQVQTSGTLPQVQAAHAYMNNQPNQSPVSQNQQLRVYTATPSSHLAVHQNTGNYAPTPTIANTPQGAAGQSHVYSAEQQVASTNGQSTIHGYGHMLSPSNSQNPAAGYSSAAQNQAVVQSNQNHGYIPSRQGSTALAQNNPHRYGISQQAQLSQSPNQSLNYPPSQQNNAVAPNDQQQHYPRADGQQQAQGYTANANSPHEFPTERRLSGAVSANSGTAYQTSNQTQAQAQAQAQAPAPSISGYPSDNAHQHQISQMKAPDEPYWQRTYPQTYHQRSEQCSEPYYRDSNANHYHGSYFASRSYSSQPYEYPATHPADVNARADDAKSSQTGTTAHDTREKTSSADVASSAGVQSQQSNQSNQNAQNMTAGRDAEVAGCQNTSLPTSARSAAHTLAGPSYSPRLQQQSDSTKEEDRDKDDGLDKDKDDKSDDEILAKDEEKDCKNSPGGKEDPGIPYDWATELMKGYVPGLIDASAKMTLFFCILEEAIRLGDRVLAFSQSLFTLNLIEDFLARNSLKYPDGLTDAWIKNVNYYRLDGSTSALEREKLINEFNSNPKIHLFLVSTRAGSLGINLVGANRAIVFDASWNPCHDTQAVCRVYRYGQQKPCFVYRLVTDNCLERKIYDRQISKQGMADRVVDQCNPDAHLSLKEATTLSWDWEEDSQVQDFSQEKDNYSDEVMHRVLERHSSLLTKQPFHHESLLVDRKDKKLSQAEKRLARRGYELEKMAANCSRPSYNYVPGNTATRAGGLQIRAIRGGDGGGTTPKPVASVRPMQQRGVDSLNARGVTGSRWIPAEVWQRQGMSAQEMTLPLDVVIPTNSPDKGSIVLKAGQRVMVLKSPKGIYMQLESGKIIAIRTALKLNQQKKDDEPKKGLSSVVQRNAKSEVGFPLRNNSAISIIPKASSGNHTTARSCIKPGNGGQTTGYKPFVDKEASKRGKPIATATAKPYVSQVNLTNQVSLSRLPKVKQEPVDNTTLCENSNSSDSQVRTEQRVEEVRLEDVVAEVSSNTDYSPSNPQRTANTDVDSPRQKSAEESSGHSYTSDNKSVAQSVQTLPDPSGLEVRSKDDKQCSGAQDSVYEVPDASKSEQCPAKQSETISAANTDEVIIEESTRLGLAPTSLTISPPVSSAMVSPSTPSSMVSSAVSAPASSAVSPSVSSAPLPAQPQPSAAPMTLQTQPSASSTGTTNTDPCTLSPVAVNNSNPSICIGTTTAAPPKGTEQSAELPNVPQGYPYAQYPRYYDYTDPRSRPLSNPYGTYFPAIPPPPPPHNANARLPIAELPKVQSDMGKPCEEQQPIPPHAMTSNRLSAPEVLTKTKCDLGKAPDEHSVKPVMSVPTVGYAQVPSSIAKTQQTVGTAETKSADLAPTPSPMSGTSARDNAHVPTAFSHPPSTRYAGPYPAGPYDPYSQHYPPAPGATAAYPPSGAPGYPAYGAPTYNTDYARMYSAFHGPPPTADPYIHRGYAPPSSHPPNYYPPFPHPPPPPYPNYSFLPPYPNPNVAGEPQPPAQ